ncbi:hypothetical protein [Alkalicoccus saliphilus]|uniref:Uncharacterized protein n=1 Tax=Alkalicoccus saliphilus TaxID=200989 RepID=A0A2T4U244_9BACI|nr:hypothetical protein [Alkalicoccus saliphilus]PTL37470.1 hypothetical protein C6Y45_16335 [Alkalicoccus saliphilus]
MKIITVSLSTLFLLGTLTACGENNIDGENVNSENVEENNPSLDENNEVNEGIDDPVNNVDED